MPPVSSASTYSYTEGRVSLSETFTVSGSGSLRAFLNIDSTVNLARSFQGWNDFGANTSIGIGSGCDTLTGSVQKTSKASATISGLSELTLTAVISSGDYAHGNTSLWAYLAVLTTGDLKLVPSDSRFLSAPPYTPTAIPVPAGLPIVTSGIAVLGWLGRRRLPTATMSSSVLS